MDNLPGLGGLLSYFGFFVLTGLLDGFLSLAAPLGGLLFVLLVGLASAVFSLVSDRDDQWRGFSGLPILPFQGLVFGVLTGFLSLSAPLGGLLFILLARQRPEIPSTPARYTPPHD